jgi:hypothetical protein
MSPGPRCFIQRRGPRFFYWLVAQAPTVAVPSTTFFGGESMHYRTRDRLGALLMVLALAMLIA